MKPRMIGVPLTPSESTWVVGHQSKIEEIWGPGARVALRLSPRPPDNAELSLHVHAVTLPSWSSATVTYETGSADEIAIPAVRQSLFRELAEAIGEPPGGVNWA